MRKVVLLCGPPGAGKTTAARRSGLEVFDVDDSRWESERHFRTALGALGQSRTAQAVVIRSGATSSARRKAMELIAGTHQFLLLAPRDELHRRIRDRARVDQSATHVAVARWFDSHDRDDGIEIFPGWQHIDAPPDGVTSQEW